MTNKNTNEDKEQLDFFFWLGEDGHLASCDKQTFDDKQKEWPGERP